MAGKYFDEWQIGERIEHEIRRTVTETDNLMFTVMTHNAQPLHLDAEFARASEFGQNLVNGIVTFAHEMHNQRDEVACQCLRMALVKRRPG